MNTDEGKRISRKKRKVARELTIEDFYFLRISYMWRWVKTQHFAFWAVCCYIFFEYSRPQAIFPSIDILPWAQVFILVSIIGAFLDPTVHWVRNPVNFALHLLAVLILASSLTAFNPEISRDNYIQYYSWYVVYFLIITIVNTRERFYIFFLLFFLSAEKIALGTAREWVMRGFGFTGWGLMGPEGYFQNSGELAILMLVLFPIAYFFYEYMKKRVSRYERLLLLIFWIAPILTIIGSSSRGAQVALAAQLLLMFYRQIFRVKRLVVMFILVTAIFYLLPDEQKERFAEAGEDKTSIQRLLYWKHGIQMIKDNPVLGVGYFNFPDYYQQYYSNDLLYPEAQLPHNIFIQLGTDVGVPGLLVYLFILLYGVFAYYRYSRIDESCAPILKGLSIGMLGFGIAGQFVSVAYYPFIWINSAMIVACISVYRLPQKQSGKTIK